jgi:hypothetical protein
MILFFRLKYNILTSTELLIIEETTLLLELLNYLYVCLIKPLKLHNILLQPQLPLPILTSFPSYCLQHIAKLTIANIHQLSRYIILPTISFYQSNYQLPAILFFLKPLLEDIIQLSIELLN